MMCVQTMQDEKPLIQNGTIFTLEQASLCYIVATEMQHTGLLVEY